MQDYEYDPSALAIAEHVWRFYGILEEYVIPPFLGPEIYYIHRGKFNGEPHPHLTSVVEVATFPWQK